MPAAIRALRLNWDIDARLRSHKSANEPVVLVVPANYSDGTVSPTVRQGLTVQDWLNDPDWSDDFTSIAA
jgi:hypothetical protein